MQKFFSAIVEHKRLVVVTFAVCTLICAFLSRGVVVNYNIFDYLPFDAQSTVAVEVMGEEFQGGIPGARAMVKNVSIPEALEIKELIATVDGVVSVNWLDDAVDLYTPLAAADKKTIENFYKDNNALFLITFDTDKQIGALETLRAMFRDGGYEAAFSGAAVNTIEATLTSGTEVNRITMIVIPITLLILLLTTSSWFEPILFLVTIGVAILLNRGTNLVFDEISFVTNAAGSILQLAVSMDYSIFLLHRFADYRKQGLDVKDAMTNALKSAFSTITSSGLTTVIGFAALILMRFRIGSDLGMAMAKAIALSMLTVLILLPVLTLLFYKLIDKTQHKPIIPSLERFAVFTTKIRVPMIIMFVIVIAPTFLAQQANGFYYGAANIFNAESRITVEREAIESVFGRSNQMVLLVPQGDFATEKQLSDELHAIPEIMGIISFVDKAGAEVPPEFVEEALRKQLVSPNYSRFVLTVSTEIENAEAFALVEKIENATQKYYTGYYLAGDTPNTYDLKRVITDDMLKVNLIAIAAVFVVLMLTMKSVTLPLILVLTIETSIWINLSVPYFMDTPIFYIAYLIISSIQLGATVDYAILLTSRYMEERQKFGKKRAIIESVSHTTLSVLTSAGIMTAGGVVLGIISSNGVLSQLGTFIGRGAVLSAGLVLLVLPGLLYVLDGVIAKTTLSADFVKGDK